MRLALFGGSFDPPHRGHSAIARAAADALCLDTVLFAPTGRQPMKPNGASASYANRMAMVSLVCSLDQRFALSGLDAPRSDQRPNYTADTLEQLRSMYQEPAQIFAIVGADSFIEFPRWHRVRDLLSLAEWIVVSRPGFSVLSIKPSGFLRKWRSRVHLLQSVHEDVSATELRERLAKGEDCSQYLLPEVAAYARAHHLYE